MYVHVAIIKMKAHKNMEDLLNFSMEKTAGISYKYSCGKFHSVEIENIYGKSAANIIGFKEGSINFNLEKEKLICIKYCLIGTI